MSLPKISAVCCTYGRFSCVERVVNSFIYQTYPNKELILYNTDEENPYTDHDCALLPYGVMIINNGKDMVTKEPYTNVGAIRRDALTFAGGDYVVTWDDDDIFLPFFMTQAIDRIAATGLPSFKPERSFFHSGGKISLVKNTLEASVVASIEKVREYGYLLETGREGLGWYTKMRDNKELDENDSEYIPSYCFNWNDGVSMNAPHKQSGDINNPENFNNHKAQSLDRVDGRKIQFWDKATMWETFSPYYKHIMENHEFFLPELLDKYYSATF